MIYESKIKFKKPETACPPNDRPQTIRGQNRFPHVSPICLLSKQGAKGERLVDGCRKRQNGNIARPIDSDGYFSLVLRTISGDPPGNDLSTFCDKKSKDLWVLIIDIQFFVSAESADLSPQEGFFLPVLRRSFRKSFRRSFHSLLLYLLT